MAIIFSVEFGNQVCSNEGPCPFPREIINPLLKSKKTSYSEPQDRLCTTKLHFSGLYHLAIPIFNQILRKAGITEDLL